MKIAVIIHRIEAVGGAQRLVLDQMAELERRGVEAQLFVLNWKSTTGKLIEVKSVLDVRGILRLARALRGNDAVLTHMWFANTVGRVAALLARVPVIAAFELDYIRPDVKTPKMLLVDKLLQHFSTVIACSQQTQDSLTAHGIRSHLLINGLDIKRLRELPAADVAMYQRPVYFAASRLIHQKGLDLAIAAFKRVGKGTLLIAGTGDDEEKLRAQAAGANVVFLGSRTDVPQLMKASDCFVFPTRYDAYPIAILEAMATGVPTISSDYGALPPEAREFASIVPVDDVGALAEAMKHPPKRREVDLRRLSIERHVDDLLNILRM